MPRILDSIDAAVGRTPSSLPETNDYITIQPSPDTLIGADGRYRAGWFHRFDGDFNFSDSQALNQAFQAWMHLSIDTPNHFIVLNIADMGKAGHTAILVADKRSGAFHHAAETRLFTRNRVQLHPPFLRFRDKATGSMIATDHEHDRWTFSLHAEALHIIGTARRIGGPPFTQVTRFHRMRGSLQRYGNLIFDEALLSVGTKVFSIPPGSLGTFDHTVGHQRGLQSWNWVAAVGRATCLENGQTSILGLQIAKDRVDARPVVHASKYVVWVEGTLYKLPSACFEYEYVDAGEKQTGPWRIQSDGRGDRWVDLHFAPRFHRRERKNVVLVDADFNQFYGTLHGQVHLHGRTWLLQDYFAVCEESLLEL
ncbi:MAG TPA: hypothetical protein DFR83_23435 [Deltaproteobacteria bacterium]|nr:hypothetical protein [Deltaproteobacteria bacterium]